MSSLADLTREAAALGNGEAFVEHGEAARQLQICNACRYCEGFCAVFPAMTRRLEFGRADVDYLAHLCHNCSACLHACQYAPPHEFAVALPQAMARVRERSFQEYAWPASFARLYRHNGATLALALTLALFGFFVVLPTLRGGQQAVAGSGDFYAVFSHQLMAALFGVVGLAILLPMAVSARRFWRGLATEAVSSAAIGEAAGNVLTLKYLDGGHGEGCNEGDDRFTLARRRFHHFTFYGFALCFASTCVATLYHYVLGLNAPYALSSAPVLLGTVGGVALIVGCCGLFRLNVRRNALPENRTRVAMDRAFMLLLLGTSASGLTLLAWRASSAMPVLLAAHLAFVLALFLTLPYGKFMHGIYRSLALLKWTIEKRRPSSLALKSD